MADIILPTSCRGDDQFKVAIVLANIISMCMTGKDVADVCGVQLSDVSTFSDWDGELKSEVRFAGSQGPTRLTTGSKGSLMLLKNQGIC